MGLNLGESHAVTKIRDYLLGNPPPAGHPARAALGEALAVLSQGAYQRLQTGMTAESVRARWAQATAAPLPGLWGVAGVGDSVVIGPDTLSEWAGRALTAEEVAGIAEAIPWSSVPDAIGTITEKAKGADPLIEEDEDGAGREEPLAP